MSAQTAREQVDEEAARIEAEAGNGGRTIDDLANEGEGQPDEEQLQLLDIGGTKIDTSVGGPKPDESFVKIKSLSRPIRGQLKRGETRTLLVTVRVSETTFIDTHDDDGRLSKSKRRATCVPVSVVPVSESEANAILGQPED